MGDGSFPVAKLTENEQKLLAIVLRDHANLTAIWLSDTAAASKEIGCSEAHVKKMLSQFEDKNLLRKLGGRRGIYEVPRSPLHTPNGAAPKKTAGKKKKPAPAPPSDDLTLFPLGDITEGN